MAAPTISGRIISIHDTLVGLDSLSGVTTYQEGERTIYDVGANQVYFIGTLTIDGTTDGIVSTNTSWTFHFRPNSDVTINCYTEINSVRTYHSHKVLSGGKDGKVYFDTGANISMNGGWIEAKQVNTPESLQNTIVMNFEDATFGCYESTSTANQFRTFTQNLNVTGKLILIKMSYTIRTTLNNAINAFETRYGVTALRISSTSPGGENEFKNFSSVGTENIALLWSSKKVAFVNTEKGTDYGVANNAQGNTVSYGTVQIKKEVQPKLVDVSGNPISGAVAFIRDTDNGNRTNGNGYTFSTDRTYTETTDVNGQTQVFEVLTGVVNEPTYDASPDWDYRSKNGNSEDEFDMYFLAYGKLTSVSTQKLKGLNTLQFDWTLFNDPNISETDKATVDAYTSIDNLDQLYDRAKSWKVASANVEVPTIDSLLFTGNGTQLLMPKDWSLLVKKDATSVFAVNVATKLITIKATALVGGAKFTNIKCQGTGTVTADTDEDLTGIGIEDANGNARVTLLQTTTGDTLEISIDNKTSWAAVTTNYRYTVASVETIVYFRRTQPDGNVLVRRYDLATTGMGNELVMSYGALETINKQVLDITVAETNAWAKKAADHAEQANIKLN